MAIVVSDFVGAIRGLIGARGPRLPEKPNFQINWGQYCDYVSLHGG